MTSIEWTDATWVKFHASYDKPESGCWLWNAGLFSGGYGQFRVGRQKVRAHRAIWQQIRGPIPDGMIVCHTCDNRRCVRPSHLFLGTHADNAQDRDRKGRGTRGRKRPEAASPGESNPSAKLSEAAVISIRRLRQQGHTYRSIAERHGISVSSVRNIATGRTWGTVG